MYTFSVKPQGCNVFSFSLRYCLVIMCCNCRSKNDVKKNKKKYLHIFQPSIVWGKYCGICNLCLPSLANTEKFVPYHRSLRVGGEEPAC